VLDWYAELLSVVSFAASVAFIAFVASVASIAFVASVEYIAFVASVASSLVAYSLAFDAGLLIFCSLTASVLDSFLSLLASASLPGELG
jgi:hypothetical protein